MENREEDLISRVGKPVLRDEASDSIGFFTQLSSPFHYNLNPFSSTSVAQTREQDFISRVGMKPSSRHDASDDIDSSLQLGRAGHYNPTLPSSTPVAQKQASLLATSSAQNVNPLGAGPSFTLQPNPSWGIATAVLATSFAQNVNPLAIGPSFTLQPNPPGEIATALRATSSAQNVNPLAAGAVATSRQRLNGNGSIIRTCGICGSHGGQKEHWRYVTASKILVCNKCGCQYYYREKRKAKEEAEAARI